MPASSSLWLALQCKTLEWPSWHGPIEAKPLSLWDALECREKPCLTQVILDGSLAKGLPMQRWGVVSLRVTGDSLGLFFLVRQVGYTVSLCGRPREVSLTSSSL